MGLESGVGGVHGWAARFMSERKFSEALEPLRKAEELPDLFMSARIFRIYALCLAQRTSEARVLGQATYPELAHESRLEGWWDFLNETYGVDAAAGR